MSKIVQELSHTDSVSLARASSSQIEAIRWARWKARTDLGWLCRNVLGYRDVASEETASVHNVLISRLQQFPWPDPQQFVENDKVIGGRWLYRPITHMQKLPGSRRRLILLNRGSLKTTINAIAHTIQWVLNYPEIAIQVVQSNSEKAEAILREIKAHFQSNQAFRALFPEHCPTKRIFDWGTQSAMNTEARGMGHFDPSDPHHDGKTRKEHTIMVGSIDKGSAGYHFDLMKFSDIVEPNNSRTADQCAEVIRNYYMMENLLVSPLFWIDVEGTRYSFADLYGKIIEDEQKQHHADRTWTIFAGGCYVKTVKNPVFDAEELEAPDKKDEKGLPISWWPERFPTSHLERQRRSDPVTFACQQKNLPIGGEVQFFPVTKDYPKWISREDFRRGPRIAFREIIIDTAETVSQKADFSVLTVLAWDTSGKCYVDEVIRGRMMPEEILGHMFKLYKRHNPRAIKIEETGFVRGLKAAIRRMEEVTKVSLPLSFIKRDTGVAKKERILNTLRPWYMSGDIKFLDDLSCKDALIQELGRFPTHPHDDILDTLADGFQNREYFGREVGRPTFSQNMDQAGRELLGLDDPVDELMQLSAGASTHPHFARTGGL